MYYETPGDLPEATADKDVREDYREQVQELEVRLTAQRILREHLQPEHADMLWEPININLTGARLIYFNLTGCRVHGAQFRGAVFSGDAYFHGAVFTGDARFDGVTFTGDASFDQTTFNSLARFRGVTFTGDASFDEATFTAVFFNNATFGGDASFDNATKRGVPYQPPQLLLASVMVSPRRNRP